MWKRICLDFPMKILVKRNTMSSMWQFFFVTAVDNCSSFIRLGQNKPHKIDTCWQQRMPLLPLLPRGDNAQTISSLMSFRKLEGFSDNMTITCKQPKTFLHSVALRSCSHVITDIIVGKCIKKHLGLSHLWWAPLRCGKGLPYVMTSCWLFTLGDPQLSLGTTEALPASGNVYPLTIQSL